MQDVKDAGCEQRWCPNCKHFVKDPFSGNGCDLFRPAHPTAAGAAALDWWERHTDQATNIRDDADGCPSFESWRTAACRECNEVPRTEDPALSSGVCCYCGYWGIPPGTEREAHRTRRRSEVRR